jgi:hypothetical protein
VLCTLAQLAHAIVPPGGAALLSVTRTADVTFAAYEHIARHHSPTGHYQRGPPAA